MPDESHGVAAHSGLEQLRPCHRETAGRVSASRLRFRDVILELSGFDRERPQVSNFHNLQYPDEKTVDTLLLFAVGLFAACQAPDIRWRCST